METQYIFILHIIDLKKFYFPSLLLINSKENLLLKLTKHKYKALGCVCDTRDFANSDDSYTTIIQCLDAR